MVGGVQYMSLPKITGVTSIQVPAKEYAEYYITYLNLTGSRLIIQYRPYNQELGELIDSSQHDIEINIPNIWAVAAQDNLFAEVLSLLTQSANNLLQQYFIEQQQQIADEVSAPVQVLSDIPLIFTED
jgi:hypothetical protein